MVDEYHIKLSDKKNALTTSNRKICDIDASIINELKIAIRAGHDAPIIPINMGLAHNKTRKFVQDMQDSPKLTKGGGGKITQGNKKVSKNSL